jgi:formylglycine-generating enzyme required for sulfatase activity
LNSSLERLKPQCDAKERVNPIDGAEMVYVPAGEFLMGSTEAEIAAAITDPSAHWTGIAKERFTCEAPQRKVYLNGYWIYKNDVTVAQYRKFCQATGRQMPGAPEWGWKEDYPVVMVSWDDAKAYCGWAGAALPTEAQWEKAARGGDGRTYPWGFTWDPERLWCSVGPWKTNPAAVGSFPAGTSPYGCADMAGNVRQWCADWYDASYYRKGENRNPQGPAAGQERVLRGSSFTDIGSPVFRCAQRNSYNPTLWLHDLGFRAVRADPN